MAKIYVQNDCTCSEDRKEVKPYEADDGCSHSLIDSSQVDLAVNASRQVGKVQVVFVHKVLQQHVKKTWWSRTQNMQPLEITLRK